MIRSDIPATPSPTAPSQPVQSRLPDRKPMSAAAAMPAESTRVTFSPHRASTMISRYGSAQYHAAVVVNGASSTRPPRMK